MIDLHSHILPGIDDGSKSIEMSITMAQQAVEDGTVVIACTPHFLPPKYPTTVARLHSAMADLQIELDNRGIALKLVSGGDLHIDSEMLAKLQNKTMPTLGNSRYFLFEPDHNILSPGMEQYCIKMISSGFHPVLTHPERLTWIEKHYDIVCKLHAAGVVIQLTAASITGRFGARPQYWSERMLDEGLVDIIASDAHDPKSRPPGLSNARSKIAERCGEGEAKKMVLDNPMLILKNEPLKPRIPIKATKMPEKTPIWKRWMTGKS